MTDTRAALESDTDLAEVLAGFTNLIMNERVRSFNEGLDEGRRAALASPDSGGAEPVAWRHKKRGTTYRILYGEEYADATGSSSTCPQIDDEPMVVYQDLASGRVWVRPRSEFFDGRFEQIGTATAPAPAPALPMPGREALLVAHLHKRLEWYDENKSDLTEEGKHGQLVIQNLIREFEKILSRKSPPTLTPRAPSPSETRQPERVTEDQPTAWMCAGEFTQDEGEAADWAQQAFDDNEENDVVPLYKRAVLLPTPPQAEPSEEAGWRAKFDLWFFRDLTDTQRKAMFSLFGYSRAMDEIATHGAQRMVLNEIFLFPVPPQAKRAAVFTIEHDGFTGTVQGGYTTREGKHGVVLQQIGTRVVHVYGEKWLKPSPPKQGDR